MNSSCIVDLAKIPPIMSYGDLIFQKYGEYTLHSEIDEDKKTYIK